MKQFLTSLFVLVIATKAYNQTNNITSTSICNQSLREQLTKLPEVNVESNWFKVYKVGENVFAIIEPYNFEEVISYLIIGKNKALLFDTGIGVNSISQVVKKLTKKAVMVLNSHTHYDHIGGNYEFDTILALNTIFTKDHANNGWSHEAVKHEVTKEAICLQRLKNLDTAQYAIRPFKISKFVTDGEEIDLGDRIIKIISIPGHTPDAIAILDSKNKYLWTGDTFYEGSIYLFAEGTNLTDYQNSISKLSKLTPSLIKIFPSHNNPITQAQRLNDLKIDFDKILAKKAKITSEKNNILLFNFEHYGFKINKQLFEEISQK